MNDNTIYTTLPQTMQLDAEVFLHDAGGNAKMILEPDVLAQAFHEAYERLAPEFGYETREETRQFDPESRNGRLMLAVCDEIIGRIEVEVTTEWVEDDGDGG